MRWIRVDVGYWRHPKVIAVGRVAAMVNLEAIGYCAEYLTDGKLSHAVLAQFTTRKDRDKIAADLVAAGLWERTKTGFRIHDFLDYQEPAHSVRRSRKRTRERVQKLRERQRDERYTSEKGDATTPKKRRETSQHVTPLHPGSQHSTAQHREEIPHSPLGAADGGAGAPPPAPPSPPPSDRKKPGRGERITPGWEPQAQTVERLASERELSDRQIVDLLERFRCDWIARGSRRLDWDSVFKADVRARTPKPKPKPKKDDMPTVKRAQEPPATQLPPTERKRLAKEARVAVGLEEPQAPEEPCPVQTLLPLDPAPSPTFDLCEGAAA